jgi:serine/threonine protein kinase
VKILDLRDKEKPGEASRSLQKAAYNEANVWKLLGNNPYCVRLFDLFYSAEFCYMVMEKCACGLLQYFEAKEIFNERFLASVLGEMITGIAHCHSVKVVHRDVKPDNFLVGGERGETIKLGDFGLSMAMPKQGKLTGVYGTAPFMCPEMLGGRAYDTKADVWSLGVIAYVLLFGNFPYMPKEQSSKGMKQAILEGAVPPKYEPAQKASGQYRSESIVAFTRSLLDREPEHRPEAAECLNTTFVMQALNGDHAAGVELPSLRQMLHMSKKVGAFEVRDPSRETSIDGLLCDKQMKRHGVPLPENKPGVSKISAHGDKKDRSGSKSGDITSKDWIPNSSNRSTTCSRSDMGVSTDSTSGNSGTRHGSMVWSKGTNLMTPAASRPLS